MTELHTQTPSNDLKHLQQLSTVREHAQRLFEDCQAGKTHFEYKPEHLEDARDVVIRTILQYYPNLDIPYHSRWRHFQPDNIKRLDDLQAQICHLPLTDQVRSLLDLCVVSVLLDAGAGSQWQYTDPQHNSTLTRSEGLAVASFNMFCAGMFSSSASAPLQVDAKGLHNLTFEKLAEGLQVSSDNPLIGLENRYQLLQRLGNVLTERPSDLLDHCQSHASQPDQQLSMHVVFDWLMTTLSPIWSSPLSVKDYGLGDCWHYQPWGSTPRTDSVIAFHKITQWMTYSCIEPLEQAGFKLTNTDALTPLAEYRNGGLLIDSGVIQLRKNYTELATRPIAINHPLVVEWRALTVYLIDALAPRIRNQLNVSANHLPLGKLLQGGTWLAGRLLAEKLRDGLPPLHIQTEGTVF